ncbi:MAG: AAA family ATPase [Rubrivivax sp.]|nr:AAA family ATPase [Rubrivivax sp.]
MTASVFIRRVQLRNFKSIAACNVELGALTYLVGPNGAGKSNFLEALHLVTDALSGSLDHALSVRGGLAEVRRKSGGHPTHFGIRLDFNLRDGVPGWYAFKVGALPNRSYEVQEEQCVLAGVGKGPHFHLKSGELLASSEPTFPAVTPDRLALVAASGLPAFRPVFDALTAMGLYNLNPRLIREPQKPQDGRLLKPAAENLVSVIGHLERHRPEVMQRIEQYLQTVVPSVQGIRRVPVGPFETLEFRRDVAGAKHPWRFQAMNMSDGTLRALGVLVALFQGNPDHEPSLVGIEEPETALHPAAAGALREALLAASERTQVIVTSHSPELLDARDIDADQLRAVAEREGETVIGPVDQASRSVLRDGLFSAGELLRLGQMEPDNRILEEQGRRQADLFAEMQ